MNITAPKTVANITLPLLVTLVQARKQARWQWKNCADEHKHKWSMVVYHLDERIAAGEYFLAQQLDMDAFHTKREIVE
jgi:hypothetical protein